MERIVGSTKTIRNLAVCSGQIINKQTYTYPVILTRSRTYVIKFVYMPIQYTTISVCM